MCLCEKCKYRKGCKAPCPDVEGEMRKEGIYSSDWIRPKMPYRDRATYGKYREVPFSSLSRKKQRELESEKDKSRQ